MTGQFHRCEAIPRESQPAYQEAHRALFESCFYDGDVEDFDRLEDELYEAHQCNQPAIHYGVHFGWNCPKHAVGIFTWEGTTFGHPADVIAGWLETCFDLEAEAPCCGYPACFPCQHDDGTPMSHMPDR